MNLGALDITIIGPAFIAGLLVLATHVPLGQQVLQRGIIFIDLAVAQLAALGVVIAQAIGLQPHGITLQAAAFGAAFIGALLLYWSERRWPSHQEAIIGVVFVLAATAAILVLATDPRGGDQLKDILVGQILWVDYAQLEAPAIASAVLLLVWIIGRARQRAALFYGLFAVGITISVQLIGVFLVFATLIIPALATRLSRARRPLLFAYLVGTFGYALGLLLSVLFDLPAGPIIVWALAVVAVVAGIIKPSASRPDSAR